MTGEAGLLGRAALLHRFGAAIDRAVDGERVTVLVSGEAGIGKTSLVRAATDAALSRGARVASGVCLDSVGAPGYWPWTQAVSALVRELGEDRARELAGEDADLLALIAPGFGPAAESAASDRDRLLLLDAAARFLDAGRRAASAGARTRRPAVGG